MFTYDFLDSIFLFFLKLFFGSLFYALSSMVFLIFLILYTIFCYFLSKKTFKELQKYKVLKNENLEDHEKYNMFRRLDTHLWDEKKLFIGTFLFFGIKLSGVLFALFFCYLGLKIFVKKTDDKNNPEIKKKINFFTKFGAKIFVLSLGVIVNVKNKKNFDYTKYLGENFKNEKAIPSIHICNHTSWLDILIFMSLIGPGFLSKKDVKDYPLVGLIAECLGSVFVDRDDKNSTGDSLNMVIEKQKNIVAGKDNSKFMLFPEGTTTNNTGMLNFKRGAFVSELPIKPYTIKFDPINRISVAMDVIEMSYHLVLILSVPLHFVEVTELPVFCPNENLFKDNSKERWLQYAEAMKDVMCEASGLKSLGGSFKEKKEYLEFLRNKNRGKVHSD